MYPAISALVSGKRYERFVHEEDAENSAVGSVLKQQISVIAPEECRIDMSAAECRMEMVTAIEESLTKGEQAKITPVWARHVKKVVSCVTPLCHRSKYLVLGASVGLLIKDSIGVANIVAEKNRGVADFSSVAVCSALGVLYSIMKLVDNYYD